MAVLLLLLLPLPRLDRDLRHAAQDPILHPQLRRPLLATPTHQATAKMRIGAVVDITATLERVDSRCCGRETVYG